MPQNGLVHIYTGDGRGKTSISLGMVMRAVGNNMSVLFCQFLKGQPTSELNSLEKLGVKVLRVDGFEKFIAFMSENEKKDCKSAHQLCYNRMKADFLSGEYDLVVLDEVMAAITLSMFSLDDIVSLVKSKPDNVELVLTGRDAPQELLDLADYVSEIKSVKHPYDKGIKARKGIEY